ncbi:hypothetical protein [Shigella sonnei]
MPLALISPEGETAWQGGDDEWGNLLGDGEAGAGTARGSGECGE